MKKESGDSEGIGKCKGNQKIQKESEDSGGIGRGKGNQKISFASSDSFNNRSKSSPAKIQQGR